MNEPLRPSPVNVGKVREATALKPANAPVVIITDHGVLDAWDCYPDTTNMIIHKCLEGVLVFDARTQQIITKQT